MEKEKTTDQGKLSKFIQEHFEFFNNPNWCPLFGDLPRVVYNPRSQAYQCWEVIQDARFLWNTEPYTDLEEYPENLLNTARTILVCHDSTTQHMTTGKCVTEYGFEDNQTLFSNFQKAIEFLKDYHFGMEFDKTFLDEAKNDYRILGIFAIAEAKDTLEEIFSGENEESPRIIAQTQISQRLLAQAQRQFDAKKIQIKGGKNSGKNKKPLYRELKDHEKRVREKYPHYKEEAISTMIYLERKKQKKEKPGPDRIGKIIKTTPE
jgi:hypothetical protein